MRPFEGLAISDEVTAGAWIVERLAPFASCVGAVVPAGVGPCVRVDHAAERWADELRTGTIPAAQLDALLPLLADATAMPDRCWFGEWEGFGWWHPGSVSVAYTRQRARPGRWLLGPIDRWRARGLDRRATAERLARLPDVQSRPRFEVPGRGLVLFTGPLDAVRSIGWEPRTGTLAREGPTLWWPEDRAWVVASEIDLAWSYLTGPPALVDAVVASPVLRGRVVALDDPLA